MKLGQVSLRELGERRERSDLAGDEIGEFSGIRFVEKSAHDFFRVIAAAAIRERIHKSLRRYPLTEGRAGVLDREPYRRGTWSIIERF